MLHRIDNTTSSLPAEEVQELRRLLSGVAAGSQDDLAELYRRTRTAVYGLALSYLRNAHDAQDLTQDLICRRYSVGFSMFLQTEVAFGTATAASFLFTPPAPRR